MSDFAKAYPDVEIVLQLTDRPLDLAGDAIDVGIRFGPPPDARIVARKIAANRRLLCASPAYLAEHGAPSEPRALQSHRCIVIRENNNAFNNWQLTDGERQVMVKVRGPLSTNHGEIAVDWAVAGHGIVLRSEWDVAADLRSGRLCRVLEPWVGSSSDIHAVYPHRHHLSAKVRVFLDFLGERFADYRPEAASDAAPW
jgi:LysR family transcriptional regulator, transcriptional activator for dmlA